MTHPIRGEIRVENPGDVELSLTLTMKVKDWERLHDQIGRGWPSWEFRGIVGKLIDKARCRLAAAEYPERVTETEK